ncbi:MAG TPA: hypothetical protein VM056_07235 [Terriglobales bacterium]|nr:hypothetical protein [Terriglobales bacterium]
MAENVMDHIVASLRDTATQFYPEHGELKNVRVVGHTPKNDHFIYDMVVDFERKSERLAAKVYRANRSGKEGARNLALVESENLSVAYDTFTKKGLDGIPRPIGDFSDLGAVVSEKFVGVPLQSIIMKGALLPGYADGGTVGVAASMAGHWLRNFHKSTADMPEPFDSETLLSDLEKLCESCKSEGLEDQAIRTIITGAKRSLSGKRNTLPSSALLNDFTPLNIVVGESGISICDFGKMKKRGSSFQDVAHFLACVESLEKYPFCNRNITTTVQDNFLEAYGASAADLAVINVLKMKELLSMFAQGRGGKESAMRKKVMWATVMKRFIQQAAQRSLAPAA